MDGGLAPHGWLEGHALDGVGDAVHGLEDEGMDEYGVVAVKNVVIDKTVSVPDEYEFVTGGLFRSTKFLFTYVYMYM